MLFIYQLAQIVRPGILGVLLTIKHRVQFVETRRFFHRIPGIYEKNTVLHLLVIQVEEADIAAELVWS